jgi:hypothetical protein
MYYSGTLCSKRNIYSTLCKFGMIHTRQCTFHSYQSERALLTYLALSSKSPTVAKHGTDMVQHIQIELQDIRIHATKKTDTCTGSSGKS